MSQVVQTLARALFASPTVRENVRWLGMEMERGRQWGGCAGRRGRKSSPLPKQSGVDASAESQDSDSCGVQELHDCGSLYE